MTATASLLVFSTPLRVAGGVSHLRSAAARHGGSANGRCGPPRLLLVNWQLLAVLIPVLHAVAAINPRPDARFTLLGRAFDRSWLRRCYDQLAEDFASSRLRAGGAVRTSAGLSVSIASLLAALLFTPARTNFSLLDAVLASGFHSTAPTAADCILTALVIPVRLRMTTTSGCSQTPEI